MLTVIAHAGAGLYGTTWLCSCTCGGKKVARGYDLRKGRTRTCGCATIRLKMAASAKWQAHQRAALDNPAAALTARFGTREAKLLLRDLGSGPGPARVQAAQRICEAIHGATKMVAALAGVSPLTIEAWRGKRWRLTKYLRPTGKRAA